MTVLIKSPFLLNIDRLLFKYLHVVSYSEHTCKLAEGKMCWQCLKTHNNLFSYTCILQEIETLFWSILMGNKMVNLRIGKTRTNTIPNIQENYYMLARHNYHFLTSEKQGILRKPRIEYTPHKFLEQGEPEYYSWYPH